MKSEHREELLKNALKKIVNSICLMMVYPLFLLQKILGLFRKNDGPFWTFSQLFSMIPGMIGSYLRKNYYRLAMTRCDNDCAIMFGTIFSQSDTEIGKGVYIGPNCNIGKCRIEDDCTIASNVHIMSGSQQHHFDDLDTPIRHQGGIFRKVVIGEGSWIGNCALIMANVGKKCIIGAGTVVTKDIEDYSVAVGNPAKVIRKRI